MADKAGLGELAPKKFLFEVAHIYPQAPEGTVSTDEESMAKTLLDRSDIPDHPVVHDLYESGERGREGSATGERGREKKCNGRDRLSLDGEAS